MSKKVCLITGVGPGTGTALVKRFAEGGYEVAMLARHEPRLTELAAEIPNAHAYVCDISQEYLLADTLEKVKTDLGMPEVVIHNAVGGGWEDFATAEIKRLKLNFEINTVALLQIAQFVAPSMYDKGHGVILATGNTSAFRGKANFATFAPTKAAQRILIESIARSGGPKGIHAAYVAIDAVIDVPWARQAMPDQPDEFFCKPVDIAAECWHVAHQPRSAWANQVVIRPYGENW